MNKADEAVEALELAHDILNGQDYEVLKGEVGDWFIVVAHHAVEMASRSEKAKMRSGDEPIYAARRARQLAALVHTRVRDAIELDRLVGFVSGLQRDKGYGFLHPGGYFFHLRDLIDRRAWDRLDDGQECVFQRAPETPKGPRAEQVRPLEW